MPPSLLGPRSGWTATPVHYAPFITGSQVRLDCYTSPLCPLHYWVPGQAGLLHQSIMPPSLLGPRSGWTATPVHYAPFITGSQVRLDCYTTPLCPLHYWVPGQAGLLHQSIMPPSLLGPRSGWTATPLHYAPFITGSQVRLDCYTSPLCPLHYWVPGQAGLLHQSIAPFITGSQVRPDCYTTPLCPLHYWVPGQAGLLHHSIMPPLLLGPRSGWTATPLHYAPIITGSQVRPDCYTTPLCPLHYWVPGQAGLLHHSIMPPSLLGPRSGWTATPVHCNGQYLMWHTSSLIT